MSAAGTAAPGRYPRPSAVSMRALLAAGVAAGAVSTPPARERVPDTEYAGQAVEVVGEGGEGDERAALESEAA